LPFDHGIFSALLFFSTVRHRRGIASGATPFVKGKIASFSMAKKKVVINILNIVSFSMSVMCCNHKTSVSVLLQRDVIVNVSFCIA
jgi:hypothetical protein